MRDPTGAGPPGGREHIVHIDPRRCVFCGACVTRCPANAIRPRAGYCCEKCVKYCASMPVPCELARLVVASERCDGCGVCIEACTHHAIDWCRPASGMNQRGVPDADADTVHGDSQGGASETRRGPGGAR